MKRFDEDLNNVESEIDDLYGVSLGNLIKLINANYPLTNEQKKYLKDILSKRNYIIHKIWGVYGRRLKYPEVVKEMLEELKVCETYLRNAADWVWEQAYVLNGIPKELR